MATSRCSQADEEGLPPELLAAVVRSVPDATEAEAAAIAAAIGSHIRDRELAALSAREDGESSDRHRWRLAGRFDRLGGRPVRLPDDAPRDPWAAAGRIDRL